MRTGWSGVDKSDREDNGSSASYRRYGAVPRRVGDMCRGARQVSAYAEPPSREICGKFFFTFLYPVGMSLSCFSVGELDAPARSRS